VPPRKDPDASANVPSFYGAELRYQRELAGLTLEQLAEGSFRGIPFLSQIERGERRMPMDLARHVDKVLGTDGFFERRCEDARRARQSGHAEYFADVAEMERHAESIEDWAPALIPGLLQTEAYTRRVIQVGAPWLPPADVQKQVQARMERAEIWQREGPSVVLGNPARVVGRQAPAPAGGNGRTTGAHPGDGQSTQSVLQLVPETATSHPLMMGVVKTMTFPDAPPVV
jgi:transcriptional regulator with XRE-family HTH domain